MIDAIRTNTRRVGRFPVSLQTDLLLDARNGRLRRTVTIVDMSLLGVRIRSIGALVPGQTVTLIPSEHSTHVFPCQVMWAVPTGSQLYSEAGLEFRGLSRKAPED
jgi:hypothetical protein